MAKIALITDTHFGCRNDNDFIIQNQKRFFEECFFPYLKKNKIKTLIDLGDTFDRRKSTNTNTLKQFKEVYFDTLESYKIKNYIIIGNHSSYYNSTISVNNVSTQLKEYTNIEVIDEPKTLNIAGLNICFIPWIVKDNQEKTIKELENTNAVICMGHLEIEGFEYYKNSFCKHGYSPKIFSEKFIKTFSGHFHKKSDTPKICYLGSPYQTTWQEYEERKGFHIFDTESFELTFIENPFRLFREFKYPEPISDVEGNFVRIVVKDVESRTNDFDIYKQSVYDSKPANLTTKIIDRVVAAESVEGVTLDTVGSLSISTEVSDNLQISKKYIDNLENFDKKDELKNLIETLYMESLSVTN